MSARSRRGSVPELQARADDITHSSVSTAANAPATSVSELKAAVEKLRSAFSQANRKLICTPTAKHATAAAIAEIDLSNAVICLCQAEVRAAPDSDVAKRGLDKAEADMLLVTAKLKVGHCEGDARKAEAKLRQTPGPPNAIAAASNAQIALSDAKIGMLKAEIEVTRAKFLVDNPHLSKVDADASDDVIAERRKLSKAEAGKLLMKAKIDVGHCEGDARKAEAKLRQTPGSPNAIAAASSAQIALSDAKIGILKAEIEVTRAKFLVDNPRLSKADADASDDVIAKYRELVKATAQVDEQKHKDDTNLKVEKREADLTAARAAGRRNHSGWADADIEMIPRVREAKSALEIEKRTAAAELKVRERKADLAVARAMYHFTHPGSSNADADASVDVCEAKAELEVGECQAAVTTAQTRFLTVDRTSEAEVGSVLQDVREKLGALMEAKLQRDMLSVDRKVEKCKAAASAAERDHTCAACASISLGADPESKTASPTDLATCEDAVPEAESVTKPAPRSACPGLALCPQVRHKRRELRKAREERGMLRLQLEVEMRGAAFSAAKKACRLLYPNLANADVEASRHVSFDLHHLRKAEADRDVKNAQIRVAKELYDGVHSEDSELGQAKVAMCEAMVSAARAAHRCANIDSTDAVANASPEVRTAVAALEVAKRQVAVDAARATMFRRGLSDKNADASPEVRTAVVALEVAKRQVEVDGTRAVFFSQNSGLSEKDADASPDVVNKLQALHKAEEDLRVLPAQIKVDACTAAVAAASNTLLNIVPKSEGDVDIAFSVVQSTLKELAEAEKARAMLLAVPIVEKLEAKLAAISDAKAPSYDLDRRKALANLELLQARANMDLEAFSIYVRMFKKQVSAATVSYSKKHPGLKDSVIDGSDYLRSFKLELEVALADKELCAAEHKALSCAGELLIATIDFRKQNTGVMLSEAVIAASVTVSEKRASLEKAERVVAMLKTKDIRDRSMWVFGLPGPVKAMLHYSAPASPVARVNDLAVVSATMAALFPFPRTLPVLSRIWHLFHYSSIANCKNDIVELVRAVLKEAHDLSQQDCHYGVRYQFLLDTAHDFVLARDEHLESLLAVIDVMIPDDPEEPFGDIAYHQMFTSLMVLHNYHGVAAPMGILSTYNHWQFCWLDLASPVAEATSIDEVKRFCVQAPSATSLKLCVSEVFSYDDPRLVKLLVSFFLKIFATPAGMPSDVLTRHYTETGSSPKANGPARSALKLYQMVRDDANNFFGVRPLGYGAEGGVVLMATESGACCAIKTPTKTKRRGLQLSEGEQLKFVNAERDAWKKAYPLKDFPDVKIRGAVLNGSHCLIMPFFEQLSNDDWENPDTVSMVREHIHTLAHRQVFHEDVQRRHVVWARGRKDVRLIDWGQLSTASGSLLGGKEGSKNRDPEAYAADSMRRLCC